MIALITILSLFSVVAGIIWYCMWCRDWGMHVPVIYTSSPGVIKSVEVKKKSVLTLSESTKTSGGTLYDFQVQGNDQIGIGLTPGTMVKVEAKSPGWDIRGYVEDGKILAISNESLTDYVMRTPIRYIPPGLSPAELKKELSVDLIQDDRVIVAMMGQYKQLWDHYHVLAMDVVNGEPVSVVLIPDTYIYGVVHLG